MLNLFQHLSFQRINLEIPKQVRNDIESSSVIIADETPLSLRAPICRGAAISASHHHTQDCFIAITPRNDGEKRPEVMPRNGSGQGIPPWSC